MSLRDQLKTKTMTFHKAAEDASARYAPVETQKGYKTFLIGMHTMYTKYATVLDKGSTLIGLEPRSRIIINALEADMTGSPKSIGSPTESLTTTSYCEKSLMGISYVFEGSALGSHIIIKRIPANSESSYLSLLVKDTPVRWPQTIKFLSSVNSDNANAISEACIVFENIAKVMEEASLETN